MDSCIESSSKTRAKNPKKQFLNRPHRYLVEYMKLEASIFYIGVGFRGPIQNHMILANSCSCTGNIGVFS